jgi:hypothetical protein
VSDGGTAHAPTPPVPTPAREAPPATGPERARAEFTRAETTAHDGDRVGAVYAWNTAVTLDPAMRRDPAATAALCGWATATDGPRKVFGPDPPPAAETLTRATVEALNECLRAATDLQSLRTTMAFIARAAGPTELDRGLIAMRELEFAGTCAERRAAVETLAELRDHRAQAALARLEHTRIGRGNRALARCLGTTVRRALARLRY